MKRKDDLSQMILQFASLYCVIWAILPRNLHHFIAWNAPNCTTNRHAARLTLKP